MHNLSTNGESVKVNGQSANMGIDELKLYPGAEMYIQIMADASPGRHKVNFVGWIKNKSLLVTLPFENEQGLWMKAGQTYVIRGFNGIYAYAFSAQVLRARAHPFPYIHFSWSREITCQLVRKTLRVEVEIPANITRQNFAALDVTMMDLSVLGSMLDTSVGLWRVGEQAKITFSVNVEGAEKKLVLSCIIRNIHQKGNGAGLRVGVAFENITEADTMILHYFVNNLALGVNS